MRSALAVAALPGRRRRRAKRRRKAVGARSKRETRAMMRMKRVVTHRTWRRHSGRDMMMMRRVMRMVGMSRWRHSWRAYACQMRVSGEESGGYRPRRSHVRRRRWKRTAYHPVWWSLLVWLLLVILSLRIGFGGLIFCGLFITLLTRVFLLRSLRMFRQVTRR